MPLTPCSCEIAEVIVLHTLAVCSSGKWDEKWVSHAFSRYVLMCPISRLIMALMYKCLAWAVIIHVEGKIIINN